MNELKEIGKITSNIFNKRIEWYRNHDTKNDPICRNNCLDVCIDYNNKVRDININY